MYREQLLLSHDVRLDVEVSGKDRWKLLLRKGKKIVVEYRSDGGYDFKSVEQLRYDFERDVENAQRQGR
ncbi:MAG TPA: hypothetical protein VHN19_12855 [Burkholderiales bacterium]|jgi:hypothetical protein|nr:hypothetical protein [Burkholderiales bacterium]